MTEKIVDILQIIPATDWFFEEVKYGSKLKIESYDPVVCFALVATASHEHPTLGIFKHAIPLNIERYSDLSDLIGEDVANLKHGIIYKTQIFLTDDGDNMVPSVA